MIKPDEVEEVKLEETVDTPALITAVKVEDSEEQSVEETPLEMPAEPQLVQATVSSAEETSETDNAEPAAKGDEPRESEEAVVDETTIVNEPTTVADSSEDTTTTTTAEDTTVIENTDDNADTDLAEPDKEPVVAPEQSVVAPVDESDLTNITHETIPVVESTEEHQVEGNFVAFVKHFQQPDAHSEVTTVDEPTETEASTLIPVVESTVSEGEYL